MAKHPPLRDPKTAKWEMSKGRNASSSIKRSMGRQLSFPIFACIFNTMFLF